MPALHHILGVALYDALPTIRPENLMLPTKWVKENVEPVPAYKSGRIDCRQPSSHGKCIGHYHDRSKHKQRSGKPNLRAIFCAGRLQVGTRWYDLGVMSINRDIFLGRAGELFRLQGVLLKRSVPDPRNYPAEQKRLWADKVARMVVLRLMNPHVVALEDDARKRYCAVLVAHLKSRSLQAASLGRRREAIDYARAISPDWTRRELVQPRHPTLQHALLFSLSLALKSDDAADLLHMAAWLEYRIPVFSREACINLYSSACRQLSMLVPEWHANSFLCNWKAAGSIETALEQQYCRVLDQASERSVSASSVIGLSDLPKTANPDLKLDQKQSAGSRFLED